MNSSVDIIYNSIVNHADELVNEKAKNFISQQIINYQSIKPEENIYKLTKEEIDLLCERLVSYVIKRSHGYSFTRSLELDKILDSINVHVMSLTLEDSIEYMESLISKFEDINFIAKYASTNNLSIFEVYDLIDDLKVKVDNAKKNLLVTGNNNGSNDLDVSKQIIIPIIGHNEPEKSEPETDKYEQVKQEPIKHKQVKLVPIKQEPQKDKIKVVKKRVCDWISNHKRQILIGVGVATLAMVSSLFIVPAIMSFNSALGAAIGLTEESALHGVNLILKDLIGATYNSKPLFSWTYPGFATLVGRSALIGAISGASGFGISSIVNSIKNKKNLDNNAKKENHVIKENHTRKLNILQRAAKKIKSISNNETMPLPAVKESENPQSKNNKPLKNNKSSSPTFVAENPRSSYSFKPGVNLENVQSGISNEVNNLTQPKTSRNK